MNTTCSNFYQYWLLSTGVIFEKTNSVWKSFWLFGLTCQIIMRWTKYLHSLLLLLQPNRLLIQGLCTISNNCMKTIMTWAKFCHCLLLLLQPSRLLIWGLWPCQIIAWKLSWHEQNLFIVYYCCNLVYYWFGGCEPYQIIAWKLSW